MIIVLLLLLLLVVVVVVVVAVVVVVVVAVLMCIYCSGGNSLIKPVFFFEMTGQYSVNYLSAGEWELPGWTGYYVAMSDTNLLTKLCTQYQ